MPLLHVTVFVSVVMHKFCSFMKLLFNVQLLQHDLHNTSILALPTKN